MRLLHRSNTGDLTLTDGLAGDKPIPPYAILSHTWNRNNEEEVTFEELINGTGKEKPGYKKIWFCGEQASQDGLQYFWVDTCCIDKRNYAELSRAINSMFRWYRNAARCYVYLSDVSHGFSNGNRCDSSPWISAFRKSAWFTRGWTLQELIAPGTVEFFSQEWVKIGDKGSLKQLVHEITGIPDSALQGARLSSFSDYERFSWMERRYTKVAEDRAYALLGIFGVNMTLIYDEGVENAFRRLQEEIDKLKHCLQDLRLTDPSDDKRRIEDTKGGLLKDSYRWILKNPDFRQWRDNQQSQLLWIKGDPSKGKTMLLCGIVNELEESVPLTFPIAYFFCQATDSRINNAAAILRGLLYLLIRQQPSLVSHIRKKYDYTGKSLFEDANAWVVLSEILTDILRDPTLDGVYLVVDALDECVTNLPKLLDFIIQTACTISHIKWLLSSRNWPSIEERLRRAEQKVNFSLELNAASVSGAVHFYIRHRVAQLAENKNYREKDTSAVLSHLTSNANDTFLWVALVCQNLLDIPRWKVLEKLRAFPPGLDALYHRMMQNIRSSDDAALCTRILALIAVVYRPITLHELTCLDEGLEDMADDLDSVRQILGICGSFLTIRGSSIYFVHQSAKDFLFTEDHGEFSPDRIKKVHYNIFLKSLQVMQKVLRRDLFSLHALGCSIDQVEPPNPDPLAMSRYSCIYWIDHLCDWNDSSTIHDGILESFFKERYLYWLEALSLCKSMSKGVVSMAKLNRLIRDRVATSNLVELIRDAHRFIMRHKLAIESSPLQAYASALYFSPKHSLIRVLFEEEKSKKITAKPAMEDKWSNCLQTLEGHGEEIVYSVVFSHDSSLLASASSDKTVKIWDVHSSECLSTFEGHRGLVFSAAFSHDSIWLASASNDRTVKVWNARSGECLLTLEGHSGSVASVAFSHDSTWLASGSMDSTVKVWDARSGECLSTLEGHSGFVYSTTFSHDSIWLASASNDTTVKVWNARNSECLLTLEGHSSTIRSVVFSHDSTWLASGSIDSTIKVWDARSGECLSTLEGHGGSVFSAAFSHNSVWLASASNDRTVKVWNARSGECVLTLEGHSGSVVSVVFSHDSTWLASGSMDSTVKVWDTLGAGCLLTAESHSLLTLSIVFSYDSALLATTSLDKMVKVWSAHSGECLLTLKGHSDPVYSATFSRDSTWLASGSSDNMVKVWETHSGECLLTLKGHSMTIHSIVFSHDSTWLASGSTDSTVKIWDARSGECLSTLYGHICAIFSLAISHDSTRLASGSVDRTVKVWDSGSRECLFTLKGHENSICSTAFSHNSSLLASGSYDKLIKVWDACSGECLLTFEVGKTPASMSFDINSSLLRTDIGVIDVGTALLDSTISSGNHEARYKGLGLSKDGVWITYDSENQIWLPSEYRPSCSAVTENMIGMGVKSGKVWIFKG